MDAARILKLKQTVCEYHWYYDDMLLYVCVNNRDFADFVDCLDPTKYDEGIPATLRGGYIVVDDFQSILADHGADQDEIMLMFPKRKVNE